MFSVCLTAKPDVPLSRLETAFNEELARRLREGPTPEEVKRYRTRKVAEVIRGIERRGRLWRLLRYFGGELYLHRFAGRLEDEARFRTVTPSDIEAAGRRWLTSSDLRWNYPYPAFKADETVAVAAPWLRRDEAARVHEVSPWPC